MFVFSAITTIETIGHLWSSLILFTICKKVLAAWLSLNICIYAFYETAVLIWVCRSLASISAAQKYKMIVSFYKEASLRHDDFAIGTKNENRISQYPLKPESYIWKVSNLFSTDFRSDFGGRGLTIMGKERIRLSQWNTPLSEYLYVLRTEMNKKMNKKKYISVKLTRVVIYFVAN
jgi:hypothetical protein